MLALETVEALFRRIGTRYGSAWLAKFDAVAVADLKADWAETLDGFSIDALDYGIRYLPESFPPTCTEFRAICRRAPETQKRVAENLKRDLPRLRAELERLHSIAKDRGPRDWIDDLQARKDAGEDLSPGALHALAQATRCPDERPVELAGLERRKAETQIRVDRYLERTR